MSSTTNVPAVLLVGGMGTRLRSVVPLTPKPMAAVGTKPFLELLVRQLRSQGIYRLIMCSGYLADQIEDKFGDGGEWGVTIEYSRELRPMGTAGAIKFAQDYLSDDSCFLVMNGDSFVDVDLEQLMRTHLQNNALATMTIVRVPNAGRYGTVRTNCAARITGFSEKSNADMPGLINAGVYVFDRSIFDHMSEGSSSLELDVFPRIVDRGLYALESTGMFIDIGTPDDYARAQSFCEQLGDAAIRR
jgi:D-glycero-alpha-D-manno-heptose 1-phosphate guanylyltransferase